MKRFRVIDHFIPFIVSHPMYWCIRNVQVLHSADNFLDNDPLLLVLNYNWKSLDESERRENRVFVSRPAWHKATIEHTCIDQHEKNLRCHLNRICMSTYALLCNDLMCGCSQHAKMLNEYANDIMQCCVDAASSTIPLTSSNKSSAVAEMGDRGHNRHGPKRWGLLCPFVQSWGPV